MTPQALPDPYRRLTRRSLPTETTALARFLIGKVLVHDGPAGRVAGRIVETEAYLPGDAAAHSFRGKTKRNQSLFLPRGHAYVYFIYGTWFAMNVSSGAAGVGAGVLLRAAEPLEGMVLMQARRPRSTPHRLAAGPGCLATAFAIDRALDGQDLCGDGPLWLGSLGRQGRAVRVGISVRIGITKEMHRPLRYYARGHPAVSGPKHLSPA
jgi:DNA-3-methyladenine glycosylase